MRKAVSSGSASGATSRSISSRQRAAFSGCLEGLEARRLLSALPCKLTDPGPRIAPSVFSSPAVGPRPAGETVAADVAQTYQGALSGRIVYTSAGHGWQWSTTLNRWATDRGDNNEIVEDFGNQEQLTSYADYLLRAGATVVPMRPVGRQLNEVVLDNDLTEVTYTGSWSNSTTGTRWYDEDYGAVADSVRYRFANVNSSSETATATYAPNIPAGGFYPVYTWVTPGSNRTSQLYKINHSGGQAQVEVDHRMVGNGWVYLGTYHFNAGSSATEGSVQISNYSTGGGSVVIADAIRFGNGMGDVPWGNSGIGTGSVSGYPREDECSLLWLWRGIGLGVTPSSVLGTSNVSAPSNMALHMNQSSTSNPFGNAVYIGFHSNAGGGRGARGLYDVTVADRTPNQVSLATYTGRQINQDMQALAGVFEHNWTTGSTHTYGGSSFGEIDLGGSSEMDATIIETAFHDDVMDAQLMRDPKVRDQLGRSTYQATIEYFQNHGALTTTTSLPTAPVNVRTVSNGSGAVTVNWSAGPTTPSSVYGAAATGYRIYTSTNGYGFALQPEVSGVGTTNATLTGFDPALPLYVKVTAFNAGGESLASEVMTVLPSGGAKDVLIVSGFDRYDRTQNFRYPYAYTGDGLVDRVWPRYNNSFDYLVQVHDAIHDSKPGTHVASTSNEAVISGAVNLTDYERVIWILGTESTVNDTFNATEQTKVEQFIAAGGHLFVSGSEIAWDLDQQNNGRSFYENTLKGNYVSDDAGTNTATVHPGGIFAGLSSIAFSSGASFTGVITQMYNVSSADVIAPQGGALVALNYNNGAGAAGIQVSGTGGRGNIVMFGFPFETMTNATRRQQVMGRILDFFVTTSATPGTPDLLTDTGSNTTDNLTNRDNSSAAKSLQFSVSGTVSGATVTIYADNVAIGSAVATGAMTSVTTNGSVDLADGPHVITARQTEPGEAESANSAALNITIDTVAPGAPPAPDLDAASDTGTSNSDNVTNDTTPTLGGTFPAPPTAIPLTLYRDGVAVDGTDAGSTWSITSAPLADGTYAFTTTIDDAAGNTSAPSAPLSVTIDTAAPTVTQVFIAGTAWTTSFRNFLQSSGAGEAAFGYRLTDALHADELPWTNLNQVGIRFGEDVNVAADDLVVRGINLATYGIAAFAYDPATFTATWTLASAIANDKLLLDLDADLGTGVTDASGNALDGEWTNPAETTPVTSGGADAYPSGNGTAGGDFRFRMNVLPGDVNRSGGILGNDVTLVRNAQGFSPGVGLYTIFKDVNGSGGILGNDVTLVRNRQGMTLPAGEPVAP